MTDLTEWIGRQQHTQDVVTQGGVDRFCATLGIQSSDAVPNGYHWCLCLPQENMSELGIDGHPKKGGFIPPVELPRRMWAASSVEFIRPLNIGDAIQRTSTIASISEKSGKSGELVFVEVQHDTQANGEAAITEQQTIVYKQASTESMPLPAATEDEPTGWQQVEQLMPTPTLLFRYSSLTFNSHRIHYDLKYAQEQEMYPELVVHGPLMASLALQLAAKHGSIEQFSYRTLSPAFCNQPLYIVGNFDSGSGEVATLGADGRTCLSAAVKYQ